MFSNLCLYMFHSAVVPMLLLSMLLCWRYEVILVKKKRMCCCRCYIVAAVMLESMTPSRSNIANDQCTPLRC